MIAAAQRVLLACAILGPTVCAAPAHAQELSRVRLGELRPVLAGDSRGLRMAPLPPGPGFKDRSSPRAINAYAPEQHIRLKQLNFTGAQ